MGGFWFGWGVLGRKGGRGEVCLSVGFRKKTLPGDRFFFFSSLLSCELYVYLPPRSLPETIETSIYNTYIRYKKKF